MRPYKGTKSIVISTVSWMGGKNPFLGWAYVAAAGLLVLLGILGTIRHLVKPRFVALFLRILRAESDSRESQEIGRHVSAFVQPVTISVHDDPPFACIVFIPDYVYHP